MENRSICAMDTPPGALSRALFVLALILLVGLVWTFSTPALLSAQGGCPPPGPPWCRDDGGGGGSDPGNPGQPGPGPGPQPTPPPGWGQSATRRRDARTAPTGTNLLVYGASRLPGTRQRFLFLFSRQLLADLDLMPDLRGVSPARRRPRHAPRRQPTALRAGRHC